MLPDVIKSLVREYLHPNEINIATGCKPNTRLLKWCVEENWSYGARRMLTHATITIEILNIMVVKNDFALARVLYETRDVWAIRYMPTNVIAILATHQKVAYRDWKRYISLIDFRLAVR